MLLTSLLPGACVVGIGYALALFGWNDAWMPVVYITVITGLVFAQVFLMPDRSTPSGSSFGFRCSSC